MTTQTVRIIAIHPDDSFHRNGENWIGKVGTFQSEWGDQDGFSGGLFTPIGETHGTRFYSIKVEEVPEEKRPIQASSANGGEPPMILEGIIFNPSERHGHPDFYKLCEEEMELHSRKNYDYAHGGDALGNFDRVSAIKRLYPKMDWSSPEGVAITYLLKQFDGATWIMSNNNEAKVEGPVERWRDISVYSKIIMILLGRKKA